MINVGVIGVGYLGQHHARIFSELDGVRLVAVADLDMGRAGEIAAKHGCESYSDYRDLLGKVDALSIVTPTVTHYETALACINAGKDILVEKPFTATVEEADRLVAAARKAKTIIQVGHLERYNPAIAAAIPLLDSPRFFEAVRVSPFLGRGTDVDITLDLMIHDIDIILSLIGRNAGKNAMPVIKDIKASGSRIMTRNIDVAGAWIEFEDGVNALMTSSRFSPERSRKLRIFQEDSCIVIDYQEMSVKKFFSAGDRMGEESVPVEKVEPLKEELKDFIDCVGKRRRPAVSGIEGRNALEIALEINSVISGERSK